MSIADAYADDILQIYVWPAELWNYYLKEHEDTLKDRCVVIAENQKNGREIILSTDDNDLPYLSAHQDTHLLSKETFFGFDDAMATCRKFYATYLDNAGEEEQEDDADFDDDYCEAEVERRENELCDAFSEFVSVVMDGESGIAEDYALFDDIIELIAMYGYPVYRPIYEEIDGQKVFVEYPYDTEVVSSK